MHPPVYHITSGKVMNHPQIMLYSSDHGIIDGKITRSSATKKDDYIRARFTMLTL